MRYKLFSGIQLLEIVWNSVVLPFLVSLFSVLTILITSSMNRAWYSPQKERKTSMLRLGPGQPKPHGCSQTKDGAVVNFSLLAHGSSSAWLVFIIPQGHPCGNLFRNKEEQYVKLDPRHNRTGDSWHLELIVDGTTGYHLKGVKYAWVLDPQLDSQGQPVPSARHIIDPYAHALDSPCAAYWNTRGDHKYSPLAIIPDCRAKHFDWQGVVSPGLNMKDLIIYEAHVRGFTMDIDSHVSHPGTFLGFVEKIPHLVRLGVNCVELLPVFEFDETACPRKNPANGEQLCNYWGYSTVAFFVPMQRFSSQSEVSSGVIGFKTLVRELHRYGIEVILDVVFNHTAEGSWGEDDWRSWAAINESQYYLLSNGYHTNYTGCGNTMNANHPVCAEWICECLRYWVLEMRVDGFRFDLASALTRGSDGKVSSNPHLIQRIVHDPLLSHVKLIAEPWDCSCDGYLLGKFPSCGPPRFAEWNGQFRDTVRCFIKGDVGLKSDFATRVCGSSDLFEPSGRVPFHSINFITAHDGFTLRDLVSYNAKHNACNGEDSGDDHNHSWNCGSEGPTESRSVGHLREKQMRNLLVALLLSAGTPMIVFGDEYGRTQNGCNNGWCQDVLSWFSWSACSKQEDNLFRFCRLLIALRKEHSNILDRESFLTANDIIWWKVDWHDPYNYLCYVLQDPKSVARPSGLLVAFNSGHEERACDLPPGNWHRIIDTNLASPDDIICEHEVSAVRIERKSYLMQPYSCIVLKTYQEYQFLVCCDCTAPGDVLFVVGSEVALGSWEPAKAIQCFTSAKEFPMWTSPIVAVPSSTSQFDFKLLVQSERSQGRVVWEQGENRQVIIPSTCVQQERLTLRCAWGQKQVRTEYSMYPKIQETTSIQPQVLDHITGA